MKYRNAKTEKSAAYFYILLNPKLSKWYSEGVKLCFQPFFKSKAVICKSILSVKGMK